MTDTVQGAAPVAAARVSDAYRWTQLTIGVLAMVMIANYQYGWTFFVPDIQKKFGWDRAVDPMGVYAVRAVRDLAGADRGLVRRQIRPARRRPDRRHPLRRRLGDQRRRRPRSTASTSA